MSKRSLFAAAGLAALVSAAYLNHFHNGFHFDDSHAVVDNPFVRDLKYIPRYFTDATTFSLLPPNQSYRPVLQTTLAIDYRLAGGYNPVVFQASTFIWFLLLIGSIGTLFTALAEAAAPDDPGAGWTAWGATAVYALHPVCAETVNYVIQRGDLLSTLGVVAALALYVRAPHLRRRGVYLIPLVFGLLAKPPALILPLLVLGYERLLGDRRRAWRAALPSAIVTAALLVWMQLHTPATFVTGASSKTAYWLTQPFVALRYFAAFFLPLELSADNDWPLLAATDPRVAVGALFLGLVGLAAWAAARSRSTAPIAFGLWWFLAGQAPTSLMPLAEVANDHRMFLPFVGLSLATAWAARAAWLRMGAGTSRRLIAASVMAVVLAAETVGVHARNEVWRTDESLWRDVTEKSPRNGRGWMNYGLARMEQGDFATAVASFERALPLTPRYSLLRINLAIAYGGVGRLADAEREFVVAEQLAPDDWRSHLYYGRWLGQIGRMKDAVAQLELAHAENPVDPYAGRLLDEARHRLARGAPGPGGPAPGSRPEDALTRSLDLYRAGRYRECIDAARDALRARPGYAEAYNNIAAAHNALGEWDQAITAAEEAVRLDPTLAIARSNLAYARERKEAR